MVFSTPRGYLRNHERSVEELQPHPTRPYDSTHHGNSKAPVPPSFPLNDKWQRDRAWDIYPYPCIGQFRFINLTVYQTPSYPQILKRLKGGASFLDLGCCLAQEVRKLVYDGAPSENLWGAELKGDFFELGYELFKDRDSLKAHFLEADIFDEQGPLQQLEGKMDVVQIGLFLHLFDLKGQIKACERIVALMKPEKGGLIVGQQLASLVAGPLGSESGSEMFKHTMESFEKLWKEVGRRTGSEWYVAAKMDFDLGLSSKQQTWYDAGLRRIVFEVTRTG